MKAIIRGWHSPDVNLDTYWPVDESNFEFLLEISIGPDNEEGSDYFSIVVCTPEWLRTNYLEQKMLFGLHHLIVFEYDINFIKNYIEKYVKNCHGENWQEIAKKLSYIGKWEFDNYIEYN